MMSQKSKFEESLADLMEDEIINQSENDLREYYSVEDLKNTKDFEETRILIDSTLINYKKNKLVIARKNLETEQQLDSSYSNDIQNAKDFIINLMITGRLPEGLTVSFREGEDIPDEDVKSIIQDLRDLGIDIDDE